MFEANAVTWAASGNGFLPDAAVIDERRLLSLLDRHRLCERFLVRCESERPGWCSGTLLFTLLQRRAMMMTQMQRQKDILAELSACITDSPLILLKGFALYAITGDRLHRHHSTDIDFFCPDAVHLTETLRKSGYRGETLQEPDHEYARLERGEALVEPHRYWPVWSYPDGALATDLIPVSEQERWLQSFADPEERRITYSDLLPHTYQPAEMPLPAGIVVPDFAAAAFLLATHEFRHSVQMFRNYERNSFRRRPYICLGVLADIRDIIRHPGFVAAEMLEMAKRFGGYDALAFVRYQLEAFFNEPSGLPLPEREPWDRLSHPFTRLLSDLGTCGGMNVADDLLLAPGNGTSKTSLLFSEEMPADIRVEPGTWYNVDRGEKEEGRGDQPVPAVIRFSMAHDPYPVPFSFSVKLAGTEGASVILEFPASSQPGSYHVALGSRCVNSVHENYYPVYANFNRGEAWEILHHSTGRVTIDHEPDKLCCVTLTLEPLEIDWLSRKVVLLVSIWGKNSLMTPGVDPADAVTLVPLDLNMPGIGR